MNAKIVVYSWTGNAAACAVALQQTSGIEPFLLVETKERVGNKGFALGGLQAIMGRKTELNELPDLSDVDTLIVGMPQWAGTLPPAINTFFGACSVAGKQVYAFVTQASPEASKKMENKLRKTVNAQGGIFKQMFVVTVPSGTQMSVENALPYAQKWAARVQAEE